MIVFVVHECHLCWDLGIWIYNIRSISSCLFVVLSLLDGCSVSQLLLPTLGPNQYDGYVVTGREWFCRLAGVMSDTDGLEGRVKGVVGKEPGTLVGKPRKNFQAIIFCAFKSVLKDSGKNSQNFSVG